MIKVSIHREDIITLNTYTSNIRSPKYVKQILGDLKEKIDNKILIVWINQQEKNHKETSDFNYTLEQIHKEYI